MTPREANEVLMRAYRVLAGGEPLPLAWAIASEHGIDPVGEAWDAADNCAFMRVVIMQLADKADDRAYESMFCGTQSIYDCIRGVSQCSKCLARLRSHRRNTTDIVRRMIP